MALLGTIGKRALNQRFLIDECLSGALVAVAKAQGYPADYVTHLGKAGWQDWNLVRFAVANDYIIVTDNRKDFLREYAKLDVHAGLVIIIPKGTRSQQMTLFQKALDVVARRLMGIASLHPSSVSPSCVLPPEGKKAYIGAIGRSERP
jgi:predicted nuclease of predicted toxin-antitoxin system